jgi:hypothetical protein
MFAIEVLPAITNTCVGLKGIFATILVFTSPTKGPTWWT